MRFKVYAESENYYHIKYYINFYDIKGIDKRIRKTNFLRWKSNKIDITDYDKVKKIQERRDTTTRVETLTEQEKRIINLLIKNVNKQGYILVNDIEIKNISKTKIKKVIDNTELLSQFNLNKVRLNKELKQKLRITCKGYPFIICKRTGGNKHDE